MEDAPTRREGVRTAPLGVVSARLARRGVSHRDGSIPRGRVSGVPLGPILGRVRPLLHAGLLVLGLVTAASSQEHSSTTYTGLPFNFCLPGYDSFDYQACWDFNFVVLNTSYTAIVNSTGAIAGRLSAVEGWQSTASVSIASIDSATQSFRLWQSTISPVVAQMSSSTETLGLWQSTASPHIAQLSSSTESIRIWQSTASPFIAQLSASTESFRVWQASASPAIAGKLDRAGDTATGTINISSTLYVSGRSTFSDTGHFLGGMHASTGSFAYSVGIGSGVPTQPLVVVGSAVITKELIFQGSTAMGRVTSSPLGTPAAQLKMSWNGHSQATRDNPSAAGAFWSVADDGVISGGSDRYEYFRCDDGADEGGHCSLGFGNSSPFSPSGTISADYSLVTRLGMLGGYNSSGNTKGGSADALAIEDSAGRSGLLLGYASGAGRAWAVRSNSSGNLIFSDLGNYGISNGQGDILTISSQGVSAANIINQFFTASSGTFTGAGGLGVTYGVSAGSVNATGNIVGQSSITTLGGLFGTTVTGGDVTASTGGFLNSNSAYTGLFRSGTGNYTNGAYARYLGLGVALYQYDTHANGLAGGTTGRGVAIDGVSGVALYNSGEFSWTSSADAAGTQDTNLSRLSAGVVGVGTGAQGSSAGTLVAANVGINTASPATKLHMSSGVLTVDGTGAGITVNNGSQIPFLAGTGGYPNGAYARYLALGVALYQYDTVENGIAAGVTGRGVAIDGVGGVALYNSGELSWTSGADAAGNQDTNLSRISAGIVGVGKGTAGTSNGTISVSSVAVNTTTPSTNLDVNGSAQFGSGAVKSTFSATTGNLNLKTGATVYASHFLASPDNATSSSLGVGQLHAEGASVARISAYERGLGTLVEFEANGGAGILGTGNGAWPLIVRTNRTERHRWLGNSNTLQNASALNVTGSSSTFLSDTGIGNAGTPVAFAVNGATFTAAASGITNNPSQPRVHLTLGSFNAKNGVASQIFFKANGQALYSGVNLDPQNMWGGTSSSGTITIPAGGSGWYDLDIHYRNDNKLNLVAIEVYSDATQLAYCESRADQADGTASGANICRITRYLAAGAVIKFYITHNYGADRSNHSQNDAYSWVTVTKQ